MYCCIKFLKKVAGININSFWTKKELLREKYQEILDSCEDDDRAHVINHIHMGEGCLKK